MSDSVLAFCALVIYCSHGLSIESVDVGASPSGASNNINSDDEGDTIFNTFPKESAEHSLLQQEFLNLLGLQSRPEAVVHELRHNSAPHFLKQIYNTLHQLSQGTEAMDDAKDFVSDETDAEKILKAIANADMIISYPNRGANFTYPGHIHEYLYFDIGHQAVDTRGSPPMLAELRLYKELSPYFPATGSQFTLSLYQVVESGNGSLELELIAWKSVHPYYFGWIVFDVTGLMIQWTADPFSNFGLHIVVRDEDNAAVEYPLQILGISGNNAPDFRQPFLVAFFETFPDPALMRRRRGAESQYSYDTINRDPYLSARSRCQRKSLYVSFSELGWQDWVLAPNGYQAFHCAGECSFPLDASLNATNHAIMQTLMNFYEPMGVPTACCAPKKLSAQSILYFDDNSNVILKVYRDMVIDYCGCH